MELAMRLDLIAFASFSVVSAAAVAPASAQTTGAIAPKVSAEGAFAVYEPASSKEGCAPLAVISRGLGAGQNPMRTLAQSLAQQGWRVIVMRHLEGGRAVFQGRLLRQGRLQPRTGDEADPAALRTRAGDVDAALELADKVCQAPFKALIGHAVGSTTALIEAGAKTRFSGLEGKNRFNAYVALSPAGQGQIFGPGAWAGVTRPAMVITGTRDRVSGGATRARTAAFDGMPPGGKRLAIIAGATHFALGGNGSTVVRQKVGTLVSDFLSQIRAGGLKPTTTPGVEIRDK
jgi:predicted dienelactone hydrolase